MKKIKKLLVDKEEYDLNKLIKEYKLPNEEYLLILIESGVTFDGRKVEVELF